MTQVIITDATLQVLTASVTNQASLRLEGNANFSILRVRKRRTKRKEGSKKKKDIYFVDSRLDVANFSAAGSVVLLLDTSMLQGDVMTLDSMNSTESTSFYGSNVTILLGELTFSGYVSILSSPSSLSL